MREPIPTFQEILKLSHQYSYSREFTDTLIRYFSFARTEGTYTVYEDGRILLNLSTRCNENGTEGQRIRDHLLINMNVELLTPQGLNAKGIQSPEGKKIFKKDVINDLFLHQENKLYHVNKPWGPYSDLVKSHHLMHAGLAWATKDSPVQWLQTPTRYRLIDKKRNKDSKDIIAELVKACKMDHLIFPDLDSDNINIPAIHLESYVSNVLRQSPEEIIEKAHEQFNGMMDSRYCSSNNAEFIIRKLLATEESKLSHYGNKLVNFIKNPRFTTNHTAPYLLYSGE